MIKLSGIEISQDELRRQLHEQGFGLFQSSPKQISHPVDSIVWIQAKVRSEIERLDPTQEGWQRVSTFLSINERGYPNPVECKMRPACCLSAKLIKAYEDLFMASAYVVVARHTTKQDQRFFAAYDGVDAAIREASQ